jgi:A/G-specific adenine glycosylase
VEGPVRRPPRPAGSARTITKAARPRARLAVRAPGSARFARRIVAWQRVHGRHDLPWQDTRDPYRIWLAEIMLQQTQVATVIPYYLRFLARFPDLGTLAASPIDAVLRLWSGLGYYSRARNLHRAAQWIASGRAGAFPASFDEILELPGVGRSTAAAICVFAYGAREPILDGNVKRVLARFLGVRGYPGERRVADRLWREAGRLAAHREIQAYTQGLMDLGATVCTRSRPRCTACPVRKDCVAYVTGRIAAYPAARPRRRRPRRRTTMLVLAHAGSVLLERRPAPGIWGGLWSLPEVPRRAGLEAHCRKRFGVQVAGVETLPRIVHGFTHFTLDIELLRVEVSTRVPGAADTGSVWLPLPEARGAALPAPVRRILSAL